MSLTVSPDLLAQAERGHVADDAFLACVRDSLPYAYDLVERLAGELPGTDRDFTDNLVPPPDDATQGQLLRAMASSAVRAALERRFGVALAFQNCHRLAAFRPETIGGEQYQRFVSNESQVLNQQPEFVNC
ncbi:SCO5389 family protein [Candidatus Protofrankia californiensis]|uniref:SCO5389 family protein n=1 Tax=Candidatus Protofrankia californiensis TaxID=1839754 RepID=UPI001041720A|nr:SCO5389 family protein [Candidatus Protofrankia californiensis]